LFDGRLLPTQPGTLHHLHGLHRILALVVGVAVVLLARHARRTAQPHAVVRLTTAAMHLYALQIVVGAGNVWTRLSPVTRAAHLALGAAIWAVLVAAAWLARTLPRPAPLRSGQEQGAIATPLLPRTGGKIGERVLAYVALTKPRIIELLLVTTVPAMVLADRGLPSLWLIAATLIGGTLAAGGANTINCYLDRDIDEKMRRTHGRPLPAGLVTPVQALRFGIVLELIAFAWLWSLVNLLAASLAVGATLFYVFVYTMWLKRTTAQNIVIGGAAGAVPVLVGWAAVRGSLGLPAWILFAIIFVWTPPHFWALAMKYKDDYAAAGVPMLPVVAGVRETARQIMLYSVALVAVTLLLWPAARMGAVYVVTAIALGGFFVRQAVRLWRDVTPERAIRLFSYSITYLGLLFAAIAVDTLVRHA
jgi:protoheme IX farnesyltransferase